MISESLIIPTELPFTELDIKRALLTYDKVFIPSPDDREFIPPNAYHVEIVRMSNASQLANVVGGLFPSRPVRPLGKVEGYDDAVSSLIDSCKPLIEGGKVGILSAPKYDTSSFIGATPVPADTPDTTFTFQNYRNLIANQEFVKLMALGLGDLDLKKVRDVSLLSPPGIEDDEKTYFGWPIRKALHPGIVDPSENQIISRMCHARLGTMVKFLMYCNNKNIIPFTTDKGIASVVNKMEFNCIGTLKEIEAQNDNIRLQQCINSMESLVFEEFVDEEKLKSLSFDQLVKLRTKAWGKAYEGKSALIAAIKGCAQLTGFDTKLFKLELSQQIKEYLKATEDYKNEIERIKLSITYNLAIAGSGTTLYDTVIKAPNIFSLIAIGVFTAGIISTDQIVNLFDLMDKKFDSRQLPGYAIYNHYKYIM